MAARALYDFSRRVTNLREQQRERTISKQAKKMMPEIQLALDERDVEIERLREVINQGVSNVQCLANMTDDPVLSEMIDHHAKDLLVALSGGEDKA
jgi:stage III sporulation protein SpoIIIAA